MWTILKRWLRKISNRHLGTSFENTVLGLEMVYSNLDFVETKFLMVIDGKILHRQTETCVKNSDGIFVVPDRIATSGKSYFVKYDGSIFMEK